MSGPKTSKYTLTPEQRRILREQMERERCTKEERIKIKKNISELKTICADFSEPLEQAKELQKRTNEGGKFILEVEALCRGIEKTIMENSVISKETDLERLKGQRMSLEACAKESSKKAEFLVEITQQVKQELHKDIQNGIDAGFLFEMPATIGGTKSDKISDLSVPMLEKLKAMSENQTLPTEIKKDIVNAIHKIKEITEIDFFKNYKAMTYAELVKRYEEYVADYEKGKESYELLWVRYAALCELTGVSAKQYTFSLKAIDELEEDISFMEKQLVEDQEKLYIKKCIDDVMTEMGYDLIGDRIVTKRSGKQFRNELYTFGEGTAVNVTYASDGKIAMELGGIDTNDRLPTDDEVDRLCEDMQTFCAEFVEIEKKLSQKGIVVENRISILPPAPAYAQVINTSDYNIKAESFQTIQVKKRKASIEDKKTFKMN